MKIVFDCAVDCTGYIVVRVGIALFVYGASETSSALNVKVNHLEWSTAPCICP